MSLKVLRSGGARRAALCVVAFAVLASSAALRATSVQSGRRGAKPGGKQPPQPVETVKTSPEGSAAEKAPAAESADAQRPAAKFKLVVAGRIESKTWKQRATDVYNKFILRLGESQAVAVNSLGLVKREDALKRAREDGETYLVWIDLEKDSYQDGSLVFNSPDLQVKYQIYAPGAGEAKTKGKVFYQAMGGAHARRDRFPRARPSRLRPRPPASRRRRWCSTVSGSSRGRR